jgi:hypothetical protein
LPAAGTTVQNTFLLPDHCEGIENSGEFNPVTDCIKREKIIPGPRAPSFQNDLKHYCFGGLVFSSVGGMLIAESDCLVADNGFKTFEISGGYLIESPTRKEATHAIRIPIWKGVE